MLKEKTLESSPTTDLIDNKQAETKKNNNEAEQAKNINSTLSITLSSSLKKRLVKKAQLEGVSVDDFASELLAEGLVLRAWEIMERKSTMHGNQSVGNYNQRPSGRNSFKNSNNGSFNRGKNNSTNNHNSYSRSDNYQGGHTNQRSNYKNIMEDSANFLEYVRNQEKKQR